MILKIKPPTRKYTRIITCHRCKDKGFANYRIDYHRYRCFCLKCVGFMASRYTLAFKIEGELTKEEKFYKDYYDNLWSVGKLPAIRIRNYML